MSVTRVCGSGPAQGTDAANAARVPGSASGSRRAARPGAAGKWARTGPADAPAGPGVRVPGVCRKLRFLELLIRGEVSPRGRTSVCSERASACEPLPACGTHLAGSFGCGNERGIKGEFILSVGEPVSQPEGGGLRPHVPRGAVAVGARARLLRAPRSWSLLPGSPSGLLSAVGRRGASGMVRGVRRAAPRPCPGGHSEVEHGVPG